MAVNNQLASGVLKLPKHAVASSVGTTYQRFDLPSISDLNSARKITVFATGACYVATEADGQDDTDTPAAPYKALTLAQAAAGYELALPQSTGQRVLYILVAAASGTVDVEIALEG